MVNFAEKTESGGRDESHRHRSKDQREVKRHEEKLTPVAQKEYFYFHPKIKIPLFHGLKLLVGLNKNLFLMSCLTKVK